MSTPTPKSTSNNINKKRKFIVQKKKTNSLIPRKALFDLCNKNRFKWWTESDMVCKALSTAYCGEHKFGLVVTKQTCVHEAIEECDKLFHLQPEKRMNHQQGTKRQIETDDDEDIEDDFSKEYPQPPLNGKEMHTSYCYPSYCGFPYVFTSSTTSKNESVKNDPFAPETKIEQQQQQQQLPQDEKISSSPSAKTTVVEINEERFFKAWFCRHSSWSVPQSLIDRRSIAGGAVSSASPQSVPATSPLTQSKRNRFSQADVLRPWHRIAAIEDLPFENEFLLNARVHGEESFYQHESNFCHDDGEENERKNELRSELEEIEKLAKTIRNEDLLLNSKNMNGDDNEDDDDDDGEEQDDGHSSSPGKKQQDFHMVNGKMKKKKKHPKNRRSTTNNNETVEVENDDSNKRMNEIVSRQYGEKLWKLMLQELRNENKNSNSVNEHQKIPRVYPENAQVPIGPGSFQDLMLLHKIDELRRNCGDIYQTPEGVESQQIHPTPLPSIPRFATSNVEETQNNNNNSSSAKRVSEISPASLAPPLDEQNIFSLARVLRRCSQFHHPILRDENIHELARQIVLFAGELVKSGIVPFAEVAHDHFSYDDDRKCCIEQIKFKSFSLTNPSGEKENSGIKIKLEDAPSDFLKMQVTGLSAISEPFRVVVKPASWKPQPCCANNNYHCGLVTKYSITADDEGKTTQQQSSSSKMNSQRAENSLGSNLNATNASTTTHPTDVARTVSLALAGEFVEYDVDMDDDDLAGSVNLATMTTTKPSPNNQTKNKSAIPNTFAGGGGGDDDDDDDNEGGETNPNGLRQQEDNNRSGGEKEPPLELVLQLKLKQVDATASFDVRHVYGTASAVPVIRDIEVRLRHFAVVAEVKDAPFKTLLVKLICGALRPVIRTVIEAGIANAVQSMAPTAEELAKLATSQRKGRDGSQKDQDRDDGDDEKRKENEREKRRSNVNEDDDDDDDEDNEEKEYDVTQHALKLRRPTEVPPSTDIEGSCVKGGGTLKHYNPDLFVELMQSCDWTPNTVVAMATSSAPGTAAGPSSSSPSGAGNNGGIRSVDGNNGSDGNGTASNNNNNQASTTIIATAVPRAPRMIKKPAGCHGHATVVGFTQMEEEYSRREREAFEDKQRMRETAFKSKLEATKEDIARRQREKSAAKERDFAQRLEEFQTRSREIIGQSGKLVDEAEALKEKKRERLFREWTTKVFEPEQRQIEHHVNAQDARIVTAKRKELFDKFLAASNAKKSGLFRDIIIESQYDPLGDAKNSSITYRRVALRDDPTLTRPQREDADPLILEVRRKAHGEGFVESLNKSRTLHNQGRGGGVSVLQWANIGDTNYGRFSANENGSGNGDNNSASRKNKNKPADNFSIDHYSYPTAQASVDQLRKEGYNYRKPVLARTSNGGFADDGVPVAGARGDKKVRNRLDAMNSDNNNNSSASRVFGGALPPIV